MSSSRTSIAKGKANLKQNYSLRQLWAPKKEPTWVEIECPGTLAGYATRHWARTSKEYGCLKMGYIETDPEVFAHNANGYSMPMVRTIFFQFPYKQRAEAWAARIQDCWFQKSIKDQGFDPTKSPEWRGVATPTEWTQVFSCGYEPEIVLVLVPTRQGDYSSITPRVLSSLRARHLVAIQSDHDHSVWIPVRAGHMVEDVKNLVLQSIGSNYVYYGCQVMGLTSAANDYCLGVRLSNKTDPGFPAAGHSRIRLLIANWFGKNLTRMDHEGDPTSTQIEPDYISHFYFKSLGSLLLLLIAFGDHRLDLERHTFWLVKQKQKQDYTWDPQLAWVKDTFPDAFSPFPPSWVDHAPKRRKISPKKNEDADDVMVISSDDEDPVEPPSGTNRPVETKLSKRQTKDSNAIELSDEDSVEGSSRGTRPSGTHSPFKAGKTQLSAFGNTIKKAVIKGKELLALGKTVPKISTVPVFPSSGIPINRQDRPNRNAASLPDRKGLSSAFERVPQDLSQISETGDPDELLYIRIPYDQLPTLEEPDPARTAEIKERRRQRVHCWISEEHGCSYDLEQANSIMERLPSTPAALKVHDDLANGKLTDVRHLVVSMTKKHNAPVTIHPQEASVYIAGVTTRRSRLKAAADRCKNVINRQRQRIVNSLKGLSTTQEQDETSSEIQTSTPTAHIVIPYSGTSNRLQDRACWDFWCHDGDPAADKRMPLVQVADVAGGARDVRDTGVIGLDEGDACILGRRRVILPDGPKGIIHYPVLLRVAALSYAQVPAGLHRLVEAVVIGTISGHEIGKGHQLNCQVGGEGRLLVDSTFVEGVRDQLLPGVDKEPLYIGDATGDNNTSFTRSKAGSLFVNTMSSIMDQDAYIRMEDVHPEPHHPSNTNAITPAGLQSINDRIKPADIFICIIGRHQWVLFCHKLFTRPNAPRENHPFFCPVEATILGIGRVVILIPHIGVINHVGYVPWILRAFSEAVPLILLLSTFTMKAKAKAQPNESTTKAIMASYSSSPLCQKLVARLGGPSQPPLWRGPCTNVVQQLLDAGVTWEDMNSSLATALDRTIIQSFKLPEGDTNTKPICIRARDPNGSRAPIAICVDERREDSNHMVRANLIIPDSMRGLEPFYGYPYLQPKTLALQFMSVTGKLLRNRENNIVTISRPHWMATEAYIPTALEADIKHQNLSRELHAWEDRELQYRRKYPKQQDIRFVNTLKKSEIIAAIGDGLANCVLHPYQLTHKFMLWDEEKGSYEHMNSKDPWAYFKYHKQNGIDLVAPFVVPHTGNWGFLLFAYDNETDLVPTLKGSTPTVGPGRPSFPWTHGADSYLCKQARA